MDQTSQSSGLDAWVMARLGTAIDVGLDRVLNRQPTLVDAGQAYGVDQNGNIYQLGQTNSQISATIQTASAPKSNMGMLLVVGLVVLLVMESK